MGTTGPWATAAAAPLPDFGALLSRSSYAGVLRVLVANMAGPGAYPHASSAMHDPLTVLHALRDGSDECDGAAAAPLFDSTRARVTYDAVGAPGCWLDVRLAAPGFALADGALGPRSALQQDWWEARRHQCKPLAEGDEGNCSMSFGPASDSQMAAFWEALRAALLPDHCDSL
jgi:hypothetical protein